MKTLANFNNFELYLLLYIVGINIFTFIIYGLDKRKARKQSYRISELTLILLGLIGGALGGLMAMVIFKHKLSKGLFRLGIPIIIIVNKITELLIFNYIK